MSSGLQLELQTLHSCIDEIDADRAREIVANISQICLSDVTQRNIGCSHSWGCYFSAVPELERENVKCIFDDRRERTLNEVL